MQNGTDPDSYSQRNAQLQPLKNAAEAASRCICHQPPAQEHNIHHVSDDTPSSSSSSSSCSPSCCDCLHTESSMSTSPSQDLLTSSTSTSPHLSPSAQPFYLHPPASLSSPCTYTDFYNGSSQAFYHNPVETSALDNHNNQINASHSWVPNSFDFIYKKSIIFQIWI